MNCNLTKEKLKELKLEVFRDLSIIRQRLLIDMPFTGGILLRLDLIPVRDLRLRTACTDGNSIFVDISFYNKLTDSEKLFILAHECWHCVMLHLVRLQSRDRFLFNIATDMEVNHLLKTQGLIVPENALLPPEPDEGKSAEELYENLLDNMSKKTETKKTSNNKKSKNNANGKSTGNSNVDGQFDKHVYPNDIDDTNQGPISDEYGEVGFDEDYKVAVSDKISDRMREMVLSEANRCRRQQGSIPSGLEKYIDKLLEPELDWKEELSQFVTHCYNGNRRWLPPSRRHIYNDIYMQSMRQEKIRVAVAIDTSGSTESDLNKFLTELVSLLNTFGNYELTLIQCDCEIQSVETYDNNNEFQSVDSIKMVGFGGTSFVPVFEYLETHTEHEKDCLIYFTDGFGDAPDNPPPYPVLWVLTKDGDDNFCSWGKKMKFKNIDS